MASRKDIEAQIAALQAQLEAPEEDEELIEVTRRKRDDGTDEMVLKVPRNHPSLSWLFGDGKEIEEESGSEEDEDAKESKSEPEPKARKPKYFHQ
ncbi:hypothetical protein ACFWY9_30590 [Amycolatopsis sp. NPDC059027]|uniref:hypothetical protein n=1 Tax=Amycolatopsis sp. NPDC059027 TaxID=3346709 RepID=UPI00367255A1